MIDAIAQYSAAISPIIAVLLAYFLNKYSERRIKRELIETEIRKEKMEILKTLMTGRVVADWRYFQALNIIEVVFADNQNVRTAWKELSQLYKTPKDDRNERHKEIEKKEMKLIETVIDDLGYKGKITWEHISEKYNPRFMAEHVDAQLALNNVVTKVSKILDSQDASPMVDAINKFSEAINNVLYFLKSCGNTQQEEIDDSTKEENK